MVLDQRYALLKYNEIIITSSHAIIDLISLTKNHFSTFSAKMNTSHCTRKHPRNIFRH